MEARSTRVQTLRPRTSGSHFRDTQSPGVSSSSPQDCVRAWPHSVCSRTRQGGLADFVTAASALKTGRTEASASRPSKRCLHDGSDMNDYSMTHGRFRPCPSVRQKHAHVQIGTLYHREGCMQSCCPDVRGFTVAGEIERADPGNVKNLLLGTFNPASHLAKFGTARECGPRHTRGARPSGDKAQTPASASLLHRMIKPKVRGARVHAHCDFPSVYQSL